MMNINSRKKNNDSCYMDMQRLIKLLNITDDIELLVKLFNVLAVHLVSNDSDKGEIISNNNIYDKIRNVLSHGQSQKTVRALNFITVLLYLNEEEEGPSRAKTLVLYAQNMIRLSGCLLLMCNMFTSCMLHQETWRALCQCLAESCRSSFENQSYCSHLIPMAIQKCIGGNMEALEILKSLIHRHKYNTQLYVDSNGISIFNREDILMNVSSMQLLNSLVQNSTPDMLSMIHQTVFQNLSHLKHLYGIQNKIGQWATIIWHHLNSRLKVTNDFEDKKDRNNEDGKEIFANKTAVIDIGFLKPDDTARLLQNVIREIHYYNAKSHPIQKIKQNLNKITKDNSKVLSNHRLKEPITQKMCFERTHANTFREQSKLLDSNSNETSFSFLLNGQTQHNIGGLKSNKTYRSKETRKPEVTETSVCFQMETKPTGVTNINFSQRDVTRLSFTSAQLEHTDLEFHPIFVHQKPKKANRNQSNNFHRSLTSSRQNMKVNKVNCKSISNARYSKNVQMKQRSNLKNKAISSIKQGTDLKNRSMTSRLFHAINDSCTTFVKTVTNIFKSKKKDNVKEQPPSLIESTSNNTAHSCSYSFTDYMRKRDALLLENKNECTEINDKSCKTCNDTISLKNKANKDHYLKETVTKLKLGINMYGCDFKKISKAMWPRETYMTPEVLYNLYRKLIVK